MHDERDMAAWRTLQRGQCPLLHSLAWDYYSYLLNLSVYQDRRKLGLNQNVVQDDPPDVPKKTKTNTFFFLNVFSSMFRKFNFKPKLSTQTYRQRTSCFLSADWISFNVCLCVLQGRPSVTGNIPPCCLKVASTCCGKPTARCRQRKAALKNTQMLVQKWGFRPHFLSFLRKTFAQVFATCV